MELTIIEGLRRSKAISFRSFLNYAISEAGKDEYEMNEPAGASLNYDEIINLKPKGDKNLINLYAKFDVNIEDEEGFLFMNYDINHLLKCYSEFDYNFFNGGLYASRNVNMDDFVIIDLNGMSEGSKHVRALGFLVER